MSLPCLLSEEDLPETLAREQDSTAAAPLTLVVPSLTTYESYQFI